MVLVFIAALVGAGLFGYIKIKRMKQQNENAQMVIADAQKYQNIMARIYEERNRCENFIAQQSGNFGEFEYCRAFLDWSGVSIEE